MNRRRSGKVNREERTAMRRLASDVVQRQKTELIIDGYNLMHVTRFKPVSKGMRPSEGELRRCRDGLLALLADLLPKSRYRSVTVVFDAKDAPKGLPDRSKWRHLDVVFARDFNTADDLIIQLLGKHSAPKRLVVVSSDHRVQVAAQRRRATPIDSDVWFDALLDQSHRATKASDPENANASAASTAKGNLRLSATELEEYRAAMSKPIDLEPVTDTPEDSESLEFENPFPDGFFDDIGDE